MAFRALRIDGDSTGESVALETFDDGSAFLVLVQGSKRAATTFGPEQRCKLAAALLEGLTKSPVEMAGGVLSVEETDAAIEALKAGKSVSFSFKSGKHS